MLKQISVFVENKSGRLCSIMQTLYSSGADIRAMSIADTTDFGIVRLIVRDTAKAVDALKAAEFTVKITDVVAFSIPDKPGSLYGAMKALEDANLNIEYSYSFMGKMNDEADIVVKAGDNAAVESFFSGKARLLTETDL